MEQDSINIIFAVLAGMGLAGVFCMFYWMYVVVRRKLNKVDIRIGDEILFGEYDFAALTNGRVICVICNERGHPIWYILHYEWANSDSFTATYLVDTHSKHYTNLSALERKEKEKKHAY